MSSTNTRMKESVAVLLAFLTIVGCGNRNGNNTNAQETLESNKSSYSDIINFGSPAISVIRSSTPEARPPLPPRRATATEAP